MVCGSSAGHDELGGRPRPHPGTYTRLRTRAASLAPGPPLSKGRNQNPLYRPVVDFCRFDHHICLTAKWADRQMCCLNPRGGDRDV